MVSLSGRATAIPRALLERANLGRLRLQHWEAEAPNAIMGWTVFQPRREQWTRQRYQVAPPESLRSRPQLENSASPAAKPSHTPARQRTRNTMTLAATRAHSPSRARASVCRLNEENVV